MANVLDYGLEVNKFKFQLCYYIHFWTNIFGKGIEHSYLPAPSYGFYKDGFGIKYTSKVDMLLNEETKIKYT